MKRFLLIPLMVILASALIFSGCAQEEETTTPPPTTPPPTTPSIPTLSAIAVTPASPADLDAGSTQQFTATGTYSDGSTSVLFSVDWNSDNPNAATIDSNGLATGVGAGTANITATLSGITSSPVSLTVVGAAPPPAGTTVYISVSVDGELLVAAQPVTVTEMTVEAAIKAAHEAYYSDGLSGYAAGIDPTFNVYLVNKCWGIQQVPFVILNGAPLGADPAIPPFVNAAPVAANDNIIICTASTQGAATPVSLTATISGDSATVTATAWTLNLATFTYTSAPLKNANVVDPITGESLGTTDDNGQITVTIPESGIVAIEGLAAINVKASATVG